MSDHQSQKVGVEVYGVEWDVKGRAPALTERLICKFLIVDYRSELHLLFGPVKRFTYHAMLLDQYCTDNVIASAWLKRNELLQVLDRQLQVMGGGWMEFLPDSKSLRIFGASTAYGRFHQPSLNKILSGITVLSPFNVVVETA